MSYYIFNVKKGKVTLEMQSLDSRFAYKQADKLFQEVLGTIPEKLVSEPVNIQELVTPPVKEEIPIKKQEVAVPAPQIEAVVPEPPVTHKNLEKTEAAPVTVVEQVVEVAKTVISEQSQIYSQEKAVKLNIEETVKPAAIPEVEIQEEIQPLEQVVETIPVATVEEKAKAAPAPKKEPKSKTVKKVAEKAPEQEPVKVVEPEPLIQKEIIEETLVSVEKQPESPETKTIEHPVNNDDIFAEIIEFQKKKLNLHKKTEEKAVEPEITQQVEEIAEQSSEVLESEKPQTETIVSDEPQAIASDKQPEEPKKELVELPAIEKAQEILQEPLDNQEIEEEIIPEVIQKEAEQKAKPVEPSIELEEFNVKAVVKPEEPKVELKVEEPAIQANDFYSVLQQKIFSMPELNLGNSPSVATAKSIEEANTVEDFVEIKKPKTLLDYLLITAYYLKEKEYFERYSLKQINSKAIKYTGKPIDHSVIQEAVTQNYLEVVPDYTGTADVTEYTITPEGENFVVNVLK